MKNVPINPFFFFTSYLLVFMAECCNLVTGSAASLKLQILSLLMQEAAASDLMQGKFSCNSQGKKNGFHDTLEQEKGRAQHDQRNLLWKMPKGQNFPIN